jgi:2-phosphoglycerate kinase
MSATYDLIYWIGGSPCSGKSTIAARLAADYGFQVYSCDEHFPEHMKQADARHHPTMHTLSHMSWDEIWMRPIEDQVEAVFKIYGEEFAMILKDLSTLPGNRPVLAEGAALLPKLVAGLLDDLSLGVWILPRPAFQRYHYSKREWIQGILEQCSDPQAAYHNWMERDARFAERVARQATALGLPVLVVDESLAIEELTGRVKQMFGLEVY